MDQKKLEQRVAKLDVVGIKVDPFGGKKKQNILNKGNPDPYEWDMYFNPGGYE